MRNRNIRHEPTTRELALSGVVGIVAIGLVLSLLYMNSTGRLGGKPTITARIDYLGSSLGVGTEVKSRGVVVGKVSGLNIGDHGAELTMEMSDRFIGDVPANAVARVLPATAFGTSFVDLTVHGQAEGHLKAGAVVHQDETQQTVELQQALDDIDRLVKALGPAELNSALSSVAQAIDGRGEMIGASIDATARLLGKASDDMPLIRRNLQLLGRNMSTLQAAAPDLFDTVSNALVTSQTILANRENFAQLLTGGIGLVDRTNQLIDQRGPSLTTAAEGLRVLLDATYDNREVGIIDSFRANTKSASAVLRILPGGKFVSKSHILLSGYSYYGLKDCTIYNGTLPGNC